MNKVLAAERTAQAQLVDARTKAQTQQIDAQARAAMRQIESETEAAAVRLAAGAEADAQRIKSDGEAAALTQRAAAATACEQHPSLLRLRELETLAELGHNSNARIYVGFRTHVRDEEPGSGQ